MSSWSKTTTHTNPTHQIIFGTRPRQYGQLTIQLDRTRPSLSSRSTSIMWRRFRWWRSKCWRTRPRTASDRSLCVLSTRWRRVRDTNTSHRAKTSCIIYWHTSTPRLISNWRSRRRHPLLKACTINSFEMSCFSSTTSIAMYLVCRQSYRCRLERKLFMHWSRWGL